jgi:GTP cyclohydrolase I
MPDHHDHPPALPAGPGIPRTREFDAAAFERAICDLLAACGIAPDAAHMGKTAQRMRDLWQKRLLSGYDMDPPVSWAKASRITGGTLVERKTLFMTLARMENASTEAIWHCPEPH